ncbi:MAG: MotA/TolQ/ExbB proton channel family protein [Bdellovibrionales bacterium]|nr:MotA/TolQ/ExbB proton channel family protein [Bdellovibrionales bacterium]
MIFRVTMEEGRPVAAPNQQKYGEGNMLESVAEAFKAGGWPMWPILGCSVFGAAIAFERFAVISTASSVNKENLLHEINAYILQGNLDKAVAIVSQSKSPLTNIVRAGLVAAANNLGDEEVQTAMDAIALRESPRLEKNVSILSGIANMATLIGLLGTVIGMIGAFATVATVSASEKATVLAHNISEAMNCTAFGLIVAIPTLVAYIIFNSWSTHVIDDIHEVSVSTLNFILTHRDKLARRG